MRQLDFWLKWLGLQISEVLLYLFVISQVRQRDFSLHQKSSCGQTRTSVSELWIQIQASYAWGCHSETALRCVCVGGLIGEGDWYWATTSRAPGNTVPQGCTVPPRKAESCVPLVPPHNKMLHVLSRSRRDQGSAFFQHYLKRGRVYILVRLQGAITVCLEFKDYNYGWPMSQVYKEKAKIPCTPGTTPEPSLLLIYLWKKDQQLNSNRQNANWIQICTFSNLQVFRFRSLTGLSHRTRRSVFYMNRFGGDNPF